jgi:hypothetical protein
MRQSAFRKTAFHSFFPLCDARSTCAICIGVVRDQMPFLEFFAGAPEDSPLLQEERNALKLHEGYDASVSLAAPIAINCTVRGTDFMATLLQKGSRSHPISCGGSNANKSPSESSLRSRHCRMRRVLFWDWIGWVRGICMSRCCLGRCGRAEVRLGVRGRRRGKRQVGGVRWSDRPLPNGLARVQGGTHRGHHRR